MSGSLTPGNFRCYFRWINGRYGVGKRIDFKDSVKIIDAINDGDLDNVPTYNSRVFNFQVPEEVPGVNKQLMHPEENWRSKIEYEEELSSLAIEFNQNFEKKYKGKLGDTIDNAGPRIFE
jgi:phosphoenolpyruvate carboxykinase (ATP)